MEEILYFIFPHPIFNSKYLTLTTTKHLIFIPTERKRKDGKNNDLIPCLFKNNKNSQNILIIFHCNGADMFDIFSFASDFSTKYNINILIPEYPGYSIYDSPLSSEICLENSLIIYDFILKNIKNITEKNIYILGRSLGTGPAIYLSSKRNPAATFLISPYKTFASVGKHDEQDYEALSKHFRSIEYIENINNPLLIIHGKDDKLINVKDSLDLYEKSKKDIKKEIILFEDMGHNYKMIFLKSKIIPTIIEFTEKNCPSYKIENSQKEKNNIIIDFDKEYYELPEELKQKLELNNFEEMTLEYESDDESDY